MANPKLLRGRSSEAEACYAITIVVDRRRPLFNDPSRARLVMLELERSASGKALESLAWVVMPDHVHWLFQLHAGDLSQCVRAMKSRSARAINAALGSNGQI